MCVPWELNPQPLLCQRNALPLSHRMPKPHFKGILKCSLYKEYIFCDYLYNIRIGIVSADYHDKKLVLRIACKNPDRSIPN